VRLAGSALAAASPDASHPSWRARSLSVYRFWRDLGYEIGGLSAGIIADFFGAAWAISAIGALPVLSGAVAAVAMRERHRGLTRPQHDPHRSAARSAGTRP